jgi:hypothetical protein
MGFRIWAALVASATLAACASGGGGDPRRDDPVRALLSADAVLYISWDANGDFQTTNDEIQAGLPREFARADANNDGNLAPIEFQNWSNAALGGNQIGPYRLDFDRNVDNSITRQEFDTELLARARDYDADGNGSVSRAEMIRLVGQIRAPGDRRSQAPPWGDIPPPARPR